jgi:hypothetical protein
VPDCPAGAGPGGTTSVRLVQSCSHAPKVNWNYVRTAVGDQSKAESKEQLTQQPSA